MSTTKKHVYENAAQQRVLKIMMVLFGHEMDGLSPGQIAKAIGTTPGNVTRDLYNLIEAGVVERLPHNEHARITPRLGQKALLVLDNINLAANRVSETRSRYTRVTG